MNTAELMPETEADYANPLKPQTLTERGLTMEDVSCTGNCDGCPYYESCDF